MLYLIFSLQQKAFEVSLIWKWAFWSRETFPVFVVVNSSPVRSESDHSLLASPSPRDLPSFDAMHHVAEYESLSET
jgi:hypothetical protein